MPLKYFEIGKSRPTLNDRGHYMNKQGEKILGGSFSEKENQQRRSFEIQKCVKKNRKKLRKNEQKRIFFYLPLFDVRGKLTVRKCLLCLIKFSNSFKLHVKIFSRDHLSFFRLSGALMYTGMMEISISYISLIN